MKSIDTPKIKITLKKGCMAGKNESMRRTFKSLGLKKIGSSRILPNTNSILGQINKVIQFVDVQPVE